MAIEAPDEEEQARAEVMAFLQDQLAGGSVASFWSRWTRRLKR
jgi:hypothetical protein